MTVTDTQRQQLAGKTRLTAVRIFNGHFSKTVFLHLFHNEQGSPVLPMGVLNTILRKLKVPHGVTINFG